MKALNRGPYVLQVCEFIEVFAFW